MPLRVVEIKDLREFTREFITKVGLPSLDPHNRDLSEGNNLGMSDGTAVGSLFLSGHYFHNADLYSWVNRYNKVASVGGARQMYEFRYGHDGLCRNADRGWYRPLQYQPTAGSGIGITYPFGQTSGASDMIVVGQPNLQTGEQSFYMYGAVNGLPSAGSETYVAGWHRYRCSDALRQNFFENYWPQISPNFQGTSGGAVDGNTAGFWDAGLTADASPAIVFEGVTSTVGGMPGETSASAGMLRPVTSHPLGLLLIRCPASNFLGNGGANNLDTRWVWVDITTGLAVGVLGQPGLANTFSTNVFHDESLDHKIFDWERVQFVPDVGSEYNFPSGELHFSLSQDARFEVPGRSINPANGTPFTSLVNKTFVKVVDFNPFNVSADIVRVHNRLRFLGAIDIPCEPIIAGGNSITDSGVASLERRNNSIYYHPPSRTWINVQSSFTVNNNAGADEPAVGYSRIIRWARQVEVAQITAPVPDAAVREGALMTIRLKAINDFGEPVAGETIHFRSNRQSTRDEQFDGTAQATTDYVVDQAVIDDDGSLEVHSGGTLLVLGVDYTVASYATGTLSPVTSWPAATISVRYRHRSSPAYPGYGSVVSSSSVTNEFGVATVVTLLPENLRDELLGFEASTVEFA